MHIRFPIIKYMNHGEAPCIVILIWANPFNSYSVKHVYTKYINNRLLTLPGNNGLIKIKGRVSGAFYNIILVEL